MQILELRIKNNDKPNAITSTDRYSETLDPVEGWLQIKNFGRKEKGASGI